VHLQRLTIAVLSPPAGTGLDSGQEIAICLRSLRVNDFAVWRNHVGSFGIMLVPLVRSAFGLVSRVFSGLVLSTCRTGVQMPFTAIFFTS
jgi:hypothetical protein